MADATQDDALRVARKLIATGIPVFVAQPANEKGRWNPAGGSGGTGYWLPSGWQNVEPSEAVLKLWRPGAALCMVLGVKADVIDIDPRNGGDIRHLDGKMPQTYGLATTPSGGSHHLIAPLGFPKGPIPTLPGIDYLGGEPEGKGRSFAFIAPTVKLSKETNILGAYRWEEEPNVSALALDDGSTSIELRKLLVARDEKPETPAPAPATQPIDAGRAYRYALSAMQAELAIVKAVPFTEAWNDTVNASAFKVGRYLTDEWGLTFEEAREAFIEVLVAGGYPQKRAEHHADHGLRDGQKEPHPVEKMGDEPDEDGWFIPFSEGEIQVSPWDFEDLEEVINGTYSRPVAEVAHRSDDQGLFYRGKTNGLFGESESGKSWVAFFACVQEMQVGNDVAFIDLEDDKETAVNRLKALGASNEQIRNHFRYTAPDAPLNADSSEVLFRNLVQLQPTLIVIDGVTNAMTLHGLSLLDNEDISRFDQMLTAKAARESGAAVVTVDHIVKAKTEGTPMAIGGQHKRASVSGVAYLVRKVVDFAPGKQGSAEVMISKDRPGSVREHSTGDTAALFVMDATDADHIKASFEVTTQTDHLQYAMLVVADTLAEQEGQTISAESKLIDTIRETGVKIRSVSVRKAVDELERTGHVWVAPREPGRPAEHRLLKPYIPKEFRP